MVVDLFENIFTKEDLLWLFSQISQLQKLVFKKEGLLSIKVVLLKEKINQNLYNVILEAEKNGLIFSDPKSQSDFLENLKKELSELPVLKIQIAFSPPQSTTERISRYLEKEVGKKIILDILVNPEIVGGAILEYQGKYLNLSLAKEIEKLFQK